MATNKRVTPGREGYKILFNENTVIMNHKFAAAAAKYGTKENKLMKSIRKDFPGMAEVIVSGREQITAKTNSRLTYENMEKHIRAYDNAAELLDVFETVKALSLATASPYKYVCDWFKIQFPNYKKAPVFKDNQMDIVTNAMIADDIGMSEDTVTSAKNVLLKEYENITRRQVSEKTGWNTFRTLGQELSASALWKDL